MRSWPSWSAVLLGVVLIGSALLLLFNLHSENAAILTLVSAFLLSGAILLAAGLHSLQASYDSWCGDACGYGGGCGCNHCEECVDGECCGDCGCTPQGGHGHEGHDHGEHGH